MLARSRDELNARSTPAQRLKTGARGLQSSRNIGKPQWHPRALLLRGAAPMILVFFRLRLQPQWSNSLVEVLREAKGVDNIAFGRLRHLTE